ncbi:hypothetical protein BCR33DRAFT_468823 [Rhizoclosmatium globosum]|uniref:Uncharacterized protein n=1 Tax=Rhizoclosmatium globosum TaxID=329046 RepID=A0A1Y2BQM1_9FUNG|nr:hypothetical protein BCR33DRAFT_468823 [Rhizoclosmatium globosum]|eukprot:ORY37038.1 hypothetical protein BCR33DRAFT_468823 [Rhizoclosmatium globosum]
MLSHVLIDLCRTEPASNAPLIAEQPQESLSYLLLQIGLGNSHNPSPISPTSHLSSNKYAISPYKPNTSTESISPSSLFPSLVGALISPGNACLTADMALYLKSTLFASTTTENLTSLSWIVNESHRTSKDGDKEAGGGME